MTTGEERRNVMVVNIEDRNIGVPGGRIFLRSWAPEEIGSKAPVILLHDSLGCVGLWRGFPETLARFLERPVIAYDRLGFGRSTARRGLPSLDFVEEEAEVYFPTILRALGLDRCALFGHSVGGAMSLVIAALLNGVVEAVVTEAAQAFVENRTRDGIIAARKSFGPLDQFRKLERWHGEKANWVLNAWTDVWLDPAFASWSLDPYLGSVDCPVLAIHGDADQFGSTEFPKRITTGPAGPSEMVILEGCGHVPHRERQDDVLRLVTRFLGSHE